MNCLDNFYGLLIRGTDLTEPERNRVSLLYKETGKDAMYQIATEKKILPFAANTFVACGLDMLFWEDILQQYRQRNKAILACLHTAYEALVRQGVRKMFVSENFGALLSSGNDIALFASGDVDNHADPCEKEKIYRAFETLGYSRKERFSGGHLIATEFFPPKSYNLPEKFYISVEFNPLARIKLPCFIRSDEFVDWENIVCYKDTAVKLPPPDALMYICMMHISLHSFSRAPDIRLYIDLLNMSRIQVDYEKIIAWCRRDGTCTRAAVAAQLSNLLMQTRMPETVVRLSDKRHRVIKLVYNEQSNALRYEPRCLKVLFIEICCHDRGIMAGIGSILFPDKEWMRKVYGSSGLLAQIKHLLKVL